MRIVPVLLLFCLLNFSEVLAQQPVFKQYTVADGLPSSEVYYVMQDSKGFIWFATDHGVCRYDGTNFKTFTTADGLADNTTFSIIEDSQGRLWFESFSGKISWYENNRIFSIRNNEYVMRQIGNNSSTINSFYVSGNNRMWIGLLNSRILEFSFDSNRTCKLMRVINNCNLLDLSDEHAIEAMGGIIMDGPPSLKLVLGTEKITIPIAGLINPNDIADLRCLKLSDGTYLLAIYNRLIHINKHKVISHRKFKSRIIYIYQSPDQAIWVGKYKGGITRFNLFELESGNEGELFFKELSVTSCWVNKQGSSWFTTLENGVYFQPSGAFYYYPEFNQFEDKKVICISGRALKPAKDGNEEVFAGLLNGTILQQKNKKFISFYNQEQCRKDGNVNTTCFFLSSNRTLWFALNNNTIVLKPDNTIVKQMGSLNAFAEGKDHIIWASGYGSVFQFKNIKLTNEFIPKKPSPNIRAIIETNGQLLLGALNGLWKFQNNEIEYQGINNPLLSLRITGLQKDAAGRVWMATHGGGVLIKAGDSIRAINTQDGLLSNICNSIYIDVENTIWVCSNSGLSHITSSNTIPEKFSIDNYTVSSGLISNEINQVYRQANKVWVATNEGLSMVNLKKLSSSTYPPPVYITGLSVDSRDTLIQNNYEFPYDKNNINISYAGLSYNSTGNISYKYLLRKDPDIPSILKEDKFQYSTKNSLQFTELTPGDYEFTIWAKSFNGSWSEIPATLIFTIMPPFWATWWFRAIYLLTIILVLVVLYRLRIKRIVDRNQLLAELNKTRQQALSAQMEPHFIFNSLNSIQNYILQNNKLDANKYLSKFSNLMRLTLDNSKEVYVSLETEFTSLKLYVELEALRFKEKLKYKIYVDPEINMKEYKVPALLIQPYVENAIWHGLMHKVNGIGKLDIELRQINDQLICTVTDNGIGRKRSAEINKNQFLQKSSEGMALTQKRIELSNAVYKQNMSVNIIDLMDEKNNSNGTRIEIVLPIVDLN